VSGDYTEPGARRALVTGAGRGIGRATALALAAGGARVLGVSRTVAELASLAAENPIEVFAASVADPAGCREVAAEAVARLGGVDVLVNCAGVDTHRERPIWQQDAEVWSETMAVNANAPFELTRLLAGAMVERGWGRIVMVASTAGVVGGPASSAYCGAKHAVVGLMRAVACDVAPHGVTCNAVLPGWVRGTGISDRTMQLAAEREGISVEEVWAKIEADSIAGRVVRPDEVADAIAYLTSENAGAINGEAVRIAIGNLW
jgi:NAD(P)-dependent dehydrogenase (short-subunit alcohol dehydrogenase family)